MIRATVPLNLGALLMSSSTSRAIALTLFLIGTCSICASAQTPTKTAKHAGSISGRVTVKDKGLAGVTIALRRSNPLSPLEPLPRAVSDPDGNYKITNVDPGSYEVQASIGAYVYPDNASRGRPVIVMEGENIENVNFSMVRGGVITGRITDADGRPVIQQQVRLFSAEVGDQRVAPQTTPQRQYYPVNTSVTDDRGIYRMFGLRAGSYKLSTGRSDETFSPGGPNRISYKEVFYPDVTELNKGTILEVSEGSEAANIDIVLGRPLETYSAAGRVVTGDNGEPVPNTRYGLQRVLTVSDRIEFVSTPLLTNNTGDFIVDGLIPGKYSVFTMPDTNSELRTDGATFEIIDSNVSGVKVRLVRGASISGVVVLDSDDKAAASRISRLELRAYVQKPEGMATGQVAGSSKSTLNADGSFRLAGLSEGNAFLSLGSGAFTREEMRNFVISRIEREGTVYSRGLEIKDGEQVTGLRVVVTYGNAVLRGVVEVSNGPLPVGARIGVRLVKPGQQGSFMRPPTVDDRGRFIAEGVPPGTYEVLVFVVSPQLTPQPPVKQQVTLQNGVTTEITIPVQLVYRSTPSP